MPGLLARHAALVAALVLTAAAPAQAAPEALRLPFPQDDGTLTPYTFETGYPLLMLVYDSITWRDADGIPRPWLARSIDVSPGGRRVSIRLRSGIRWHDGRPLTARDVAFTFRHYRRRPHPRFTPQLEAVASVRAAGPLAVVMRLRHTSAGLLDQPLADLPILPRHLWSGLAPRALAPDGPPIGSGPFRLKGRLPRGGYRLRANRRYFRGSPAVAAIDVPVIRSAQDTFDAFARGDVDVLGVPLPEGAREALAGLDVIVAEGPSYAGITLTFNVRRPPFDDPGARRTAASTLDLGRIASGAGGIGASAGAIPADRGFLHPESRWAARETLHRFDPAARPDLPPFELLAPDNDPVRLQAGRTVAGSLREAGVDVTLSALPPGELALRTGQDGARPDFDAAITTSPPLASHDPDFLRTVFGSGGTLNRSGYASEAFDRLAARAAAAPAETRQAAVTAELELLAREAPAIPLSFPAGVFAYRARAHDGWVYVKGGGIVDKRSFLRGEAAAPEPVAEPAAPRSPAERSPLRWLAVGFGAAALLLVVFGSLRRRR